MSIQRVSRREVLRRLTASVAACMTCGAPALLRAQSFVGAPAHPVPRKGITGERVAGADMLAKSSHLIPLFDSVRAIPQVVDGIRCHCGCADLDGHYSLLTCYEGENAMAKSCPICQGMGRIAVRLHKAGRSLNDIREAVDAQFG